MSEVQEDTSGTTPRRLTWSQRLWKWLFFGWWDERRRAIDLQILWPSCKRQAESLDDARAAFVVHMSMDTAYDGMTTDELDDFIYNKLV